MLPISHPGDQQLVDIFQQCAVLRRKQGMKPFRYAVLLTKTDLCEPWSLTFKGVDCLKQLQILDGLGTQTFLRNRSSQIVTWQGLRFQVFFSARRTAVPHQGYREEVGKRLAASRLMHRVLAINETSAGL